MDEGKLKAIAVGTLAVIATVGAVHAVVGYLASNDRKLIEIAIAAVHRLRRIHMACMEDTFYSLAEPDVRLTIIKPYYDSMVMAWKTELRESDVKILEAYVLSNLKQIIKPEEQK